MNRRYERAAIVLTSNKGFEKWGSVLGDEVMVAALIDPALHHFHLGSIRGNSYRLRNHAASQPTCTAEPALTPSVRRSRKPKAVAAS